jgi:thiol-disulfide isomerase/thioredoxin
MMVNRIALAFCFISLNVFAQGKFSFALNTARTVDSIDFFCFSQENYQRQPFKQNMVFQPSSRAIDYYRFRCFISGKIVQKGFWLDSGAVKINLSFDGKELEIDSVLNSPFYYYAEAVQTQSVTLYNDLTNYNEYVLSVFEKNSNNLFGLIVANSFIQKNRNDITSIKSFSDRLTKIPVELRGHPFYESAHGFIDGILKVKLIHEQAYQFLNVDGSTISPNYVGRLRVLDFWFTGCAPCVADHKVIVKNLLFFKNKGVEIVSISIDESFDVWKRYLKKSSYTWTNLLITDQSRQILSLLGVSTYPTYYIVNAKDEIVASYNSIEEVISYLN